MGCGTSKQKGGGDQKKPEKASSLTKDLKEFNNIQIEAHNKYRKMHQVGNVVFDENLAQGAQEWAEKCHRETIFEHAPDEVCKGAGENLAMYGSSDPNDKKLSTTGMATDMWYDEVKDYDHNNPGFAMSTGHFT